MVNGMATPVLVHITPCVCECWKAKISMWMCIATAVFSEKNSRRRRLCGTAADKGVPFTLPARWPAAWGIDWCVSMGAEEGRRPGICLGSPTLLGVARGAVGGWEVD